jgi:translation initiation factor 1A
MPNAKGGKNYKKGKHHDASPIMLERVEGQMPARITRLLGNRNMLVYCNDNKMRICHICGKMKGRVFVGVGDVVLISLRDFGEGSNRGDIIGKYAAEQYSSLKKEDGVNPNIFLKLEGMKGVGLEALGNEVGEIAEDVDDAFEFETGIVEEVEHTEKPNHRPKPDRDLNDDDIDNI